MKRRSFLVWLAGALVSAREAFVGDVEAEEPCITSEGPTVITPPAGWEICDYGINHIAIRKAYHERSETE